MKVSNNLLKRDLWGPRESAENVRVDSAQRRTFVNAIRMPEGMYCYVPTNFQHLVWNQAMENCGGARPECA